MILSQHFRVFYSGPRECVCLTICMIHDEVQIIKICLMNCSCTSYIEGKLRISSKFLSCWTSSHISSTTSVSCSPFSAVVKRVQFSEPCPRNIPVTSPLDPRTQRKKKIAVPWSQEREWGKGVKRKRTMQTCKFRSFLSLFLNFSLRGT